MVKQIFWISVITTSFAALFLACGSGGKVTGSCASDQGIQFTLSAIKDTLPLDSLDVSIAVAGGSPQNFNVNLKTGVSSTTVTAAQGQSYQLTFALFSAGHKIGTGQAKGVLDCGMNVALAPAWDTVSTQQAKKELRQGTLLPAQLSQYDTQAVAGKPLLLPLDSLTTGIYRWYLKVADSNVVVGEGAVFKLVIPDSLAGKKVVLRLQVVIGNTVKEERIWTITVLPAVANDLPAKRTVQADSNSKDGISQVFGYQQGRLAVVSTYDVLNPGKDDSISEVDSLGYDSQGRLTSVAQFLSDGTEADSVFGYDSQGRLAAVDVAQGNSHVTDSLYYDANGPAGSRRYVDGKITERVKSNWPTPTRRVDSVFSVDSTGAKWTRLMENTFRNDSLIERTVSVVRDGLKPNSREVIGYNALGSRAYHYYYVESGVSTLDRSESYRYDAKGRLQSELITDEVTGLMEQIMRITYAPAAAAKSAAQGSVLPVNSAAYLASSRASQRLENTLADLRFVRSDWKRIGLRLNHDKGK